MIEVSETKLSQIRYLLGQSMQGHHLLFDSDSLRRVFGCSEKRRARLLEAEQARSVEDHIEKMIALPSLVRMREYLEELDSGTYEWVVRTYFHIVENNIAENPEMRH